MTKKSTKRALLVSVLSLFVCFTMLIGTTYAWFTDSVTSSGNIIKTGTLDVTLEYSEKAPANKDDALWTDASTGAIFSYDNWEPGYVQVRYVKIENEGTLDLKFVLNIVPNANATDVDLADVIEVYMVGDAVSVNRADLTTTSAAYKGTLASLIADEDGAAYGTLTDGACEIYTIALKMSESAGNEYQNKSVGTSFVVQLLATQLSANAETDDLGAGYDDEATYPEMSFGAASKEENAPAQVTTKDENNNVEVVVDIPAGAPEGNYTVEIGDKEETTDDAGNTTLAVDITLKKDGAKVTPDGTTVYTVSYNVGVGKTILGVTHNGENVDDYEYVQDTGILSFDTDSFSPFSFTFCDDPAYGKVAKLGDTYYESFADAYAAAAAGDTITFVNNVNGFDVTLKKAITLDLGGKTIKDAYIKIEADVTVQNGSIKNVSQSYPLVVNKGALTVENVAIEASKSDRTIWLRNSGTVLNFNSGSILATKGENNSNSSIYGVWVDKGATANINGGTIVVDGGESAKAVAIFGNYVNTVNMTGGKLSTSGSNYSYGIWADGAVTVTGGEIVTNENRYGYSNGITYGYNYAIYTKGDVTISGGKITTNGFKGYLVNAAGTNQKINISDVEFANVLTEIDKTKGGHKAPAIVNGSSAIVNVTGGTFKDVSDISAYVADGYVVNNNGAGTVTVTEKTVTVSTTDELVAAITNKTAKKVYLNSGDYALRFTNNTNFNVDGMTFVGNGDVNLSISSSEGWYGRVQGDNVTFENIHFISAVGTIGKATYNNCVFDSWAICAVNHAETYYNDCVINGCLNTSSDFDSGNVYVNDSTVAKAEYSFRSSASVMNFKDCTIGELISWNANTVLDNSTVTTLDDSNMTTGTIVIK